MPFKSLHALALLLLCALTQNAIASESHPQWQVAPLSKSEMADIRSTKLGHAYRIFISIPDAPAPAEGYPVLYVLDGNAAFPVAAFLARNAAARRAVTGHPPLLVVGIGYPGDKDYDTESRKRDYTVASGPLSDQYAEGGADRFLEFIDAELKPLVAEKYKTNPRQQALFGHSFGGLFTLNALLTRPDSFSAFIISSPSIWWSDKVVLSRLAQLKASATPRVQISVGSLEGVIPKGNVSAHTRAVLESRAMIPEARKLAEALSNLPGWEARVRFFELEGEDHGRVWMPAMSRGVSDFLDHQ